LTKVAHFDWSKLLFSADCGIGSVRPNYTFALGPFALGSFALKVGLFALIIK